MHLLLKLSVESVFNSLYWILWIQVLSILRIWSCTYWPRQQVWTTVWTIPLSTCKWVLFNYQTCIYKLKLVPYILNEQSTNILHLIISIYCQLHIRHSQLKGQCSNLQILSWKALCRVNIFIILIAGREVEGWWLTRHPHVCGNSGGDHRW